MTVRHRSEVTFAFRISRIHLYISTVFKRNDGQPNMGVAAAAAVSPSPAASSTGLKAE